MKYILCFCLVGLISLHFTTPAETQVPPKKESWYRLVHLKFKPGKMQEGMSVGDQYFTAAYKKADYSVQVFELENDEWDALILIELKAGKAGFEKPMPEKVWKHMVEIAGSAEKMEAIIQKFETQLVDHQKAELVKLR